MRASNVSILAAFLALAVAIPASADEDPLLALAKAKAALSLAQAQREREKPVREEFAIRQTGCFEDRELAQAEATRSGKPLVFVVGMNCDEIPNLRDELHKESVMCHLSELNGSRAARLAVMSQDNKHYWVFPKGDIASGKFKVADVRATWVPKISFTLSGQDCPDGMCPVPNRR